MVWKKGRLDVLPISLNHSVFVCYDTINPMQGAELIQKHPLSFFILYSLVQSNLESSRSDPLQNQTLTAYQLNLDHGIRENKYSQ